MLKRKLLAGMMVALLGVSTFVAQPALAYRDDTDNDDSGHRRGNSGRESRITEVLTGWMEYEWENENEYEYEYEFENEYENEFESIHQNRGRDHTSHYFYWR